MWVLIQHCTPPAAAEALAQRPQHPPTVLAAHHFPFGCRIRNEDKLLSLPAHDQFRWLVSTQLTPSQVPARQAQCPPEAEQPMLCLRCPAPFRAARIAAVRLPGSSPVQRGISLGWVPVQHSIGGSA